MIQPFQNVILIAMDTLFGAWVELLRFFETIIDKIKWLKSILIIVTQ